jgi:putative redox protein
MAAPKPDTELELIWEHDLVFSGKSGDARMTLDSDGAAGPSPMQALAFAVGACMAMDVVHILTKGRHDVRGLRVDLAGRRAPEAPRRFTAVTLRFTITGDVPRDPIDRAIQLSRDKYCSAWHSLRQDIVLDTEVVVSSGA